MWTVVNLVERFGDKYDFFVVTRNHDGKTDLTPYTDVLTNEWNDLANESVYYVSPEMYGKQMAARLVSEVEPDAVFLNSAFSLTGRTFLEARKKRMFEDIPVILAPCGEISRPSMSIKALKKKLFLKYALFFDLYGGVIWKASSEVEASEIRGLIGESVEIMTAPDVVPNLIIPDFSVETKPPKQVGKATFTCVARIARIKNIDFFLERLAEIDSGNIEFEIVGPVEDKEYWSECENLIKGLPTNITVTHSGPLPYKDVLTKLLQSHFFVLPSLHENFGYVFLEALSAGCPIILSENTIWSGIDQAEAGWAVELRDIEKWKRTIQRCVDMDSDEFKIHSSNAREWAIQWLRSSGDVAANQKVFDRALDGTVPVSNETASG